MLNGVAVNKINNNKKENNIFFVCKKIYYTKKQNTSEYSQNVLRKNTLQRAKSDSAKIQLFIW